jgi:hypothetical protein
VAQVLIDLPAGCLGFDDAIPAITVTWNGYARTSEVRELHERLLDLIATYQVNKVLADDTALPTIASDDRRWIIDNWMPRAVAAGLRTAAAKRSNSHFGRVAVGSLHAGAPPELNVMRFDDLAVAREWLRNVA